MLDGGKPRGNEGAARNVEGVLGLRGEPAFAKSADCALIPLTRHALENKNMSVADAALPHRRNNLLRIMHILRTDGPGIHRPEFAYVPSSFERLERTNCQFVGAKLTDAEKNQENHQQKTKTQLNRGRLGCSARSAHRNRPRPT